METLEVYLTMIITEGEHSTLMLLVFKEPNYPSSHKGSLKSNFLILVVLELCEFSLL